MRRLLMFFLLPLAIVGGLYMLVVLNWNYSTGERAGWVQKLSKKGWFCKTWEGEMAMVSMPGATPEKFLFTVWDDGVAERINKLMGKRVSLHYEEKVGLPTSCFGDTRHFITRVMLVDDIPLAPGLSFPQRAPDSPASSAPGGPAASPPPGAPAAPPPGATPAPQVPATPPSDVPAPAAPAPAPAPAPPSAPAPAVPAPAVPAPAK